jgi:hypothetical protein
MSVAEKGKSLWHKIYEGSKPFGALLTAAFLALLGFITSNYLSTKQERDSEYTLYTELTSKREESDTNLRQQMLSLMMNKFLNGTKADMEQQVLGLELLARNFHESLELSPLFNHVRREIEARPNTDKKNQEFMLRLKRVATDVAGKQIETLQGAGQTREWHVDIFGTDQDPGTGSAFRHCFPLYAKDAVGLTSDADTDAQQPGPGSERCIRVEVLNFDIPDERLRVRLESSTTEGERIDVNFLLDYFDFPMVNNTRLSDGQRCAVVLRNLDHESGADLALVYFPGSYASLRDKPYIDEILNDLKSNASRSAGPAKKPNK